MEVYRITRTPFSHALKASGIAGRWNKDREEVLYASASRSLASLEMLVHQGKQKPHLSFRMMVISLPEKASFVRTISMDELPRNWRKLSAYARLQDLGSAWYNSFETPILKVPSVVIPQEFNYIIHTQHPDVALRVSLMRTESFYWDDRL
jgi:RES domain-containing protein